MKAEMARHDGRSPAHIAALTATLTSTVQAIFAAALTAILITGCSVLPTPRAPQMQYDFGPPPPMSASVRLDKSVTLHEAAAPIWLDAPVMHYRLAQAAPAQPRAYADSRWVMSPAALFTQRLRERLASATRGAYSPTDSVRTDLVLRIEVEEFSQVFDSATASRGVVRLRASLAAPNQPPIQKSFSVERPAPAANADGGARALIAASDEAIRQITAWMAEAAKGG